MMRYPTPIARTCWRLLVFLLLIPSLSHAFDRDQAADSAYIAQNYIKKEFMVPMRDGVKLFTAVYLPKDSSQFYPVMLYRTPYSCSPYGVENFRSSLGPSWKFVTGKYIFVYQDVRGKFMSEGEFVNMRPMIKRDENFSPSYKKMIDESTDTYDTIEWLLKAIKNNNGKVGMWGISYPGFYAAAAAIDAHPALKAVSPQAPIADWFFDDFHHHGAFFLPHAFGFLAVFSQPRHGQTQHWGERFQFPTPDGYRFFLEEVGALKNVNDQFFGDSIEYWKEIISHPNYDAYWQARNLLPHLKDIKPALLIVGGWYDAEDLYGPLNIYRAIEKSTPKNDNHLIMGPWRHGGWARDDGSQLGYVGFGKDPTPSRFYQDRIEYPFFSHHLKGSGFLDLPEAFVFETGTNIWRQFKTWPPQKVEKKMLYFHPDHELSFEAPEEKTGFDEFISDPNRPVPYTEEITTGMTKAYMTDDQRFAARRPDVLYFQTEPLDKPITLAGDLPIKLKVSTTGTDADWIVKLIDVYPDDHPGYAHNPEDKKMGGYQQMVRSEVIRGRFRESYETPKPFVPKKVTEVNFPLQDVLHTFKKGHRIMIQVQSTWFPLVDRNPQKYVPSIFDANESDFTKATHRVYYSIDSPSGVEVGVLKE